MKDYSDQIIFHISDKQEATDLGGSVFLLVQKLVFFEPFLASTVTQLLSALHTPYHSERSPQWKHQI